MDSGPFSHLPFSARLTGAIAHSLLMDRYDFALDESQSESEWSESASDSSSGGSDSEASRATQ